VRQLAGIAVTAGAVATSHDVAAIFAAFVMTSGFATQLVNANRPQSLDVTVLIALSAVVGTLVSAPFVQIGNPAQLQLPACAFYVILTTG
jgi:hypothetical protein